MICSTRAFVLKSYDFRETSRIAVFFSKDFGKIKGILKGIRKDHRKFSTSLTPLSLNHIIFYKKRVSEIHLVSQCDMQEDFALISPDLKDIVSLSFVSELIDFVMPLEDPNPEVFDLIHNFLIALKQKRQDYRHIFQIKMLRLSGFKPHFDSCLICESKILSKGYFSHSKGGLLCPKCLYHDREAEPVSQGVIATILYIERSGWHSALRVNMMGPMRKQLDSILASFMHFHLGRTLRTDRFADEILKI